MVVDKVSNRVIEILGEIIEENIDNFRDTNKSEDNDYDSFEVSPGYGNNLFYLEKIDGSYYQSLYGLIHYIMYEEGLYKKFLDNEWYSEMEEGVLNHPEKIFYLSDYADDDEFTEIQEGIIDVVYSRGISFVAYKLTKLGFKLPVEFEEYFDEEFEDLSENLITVSSTEELKKYIKDGKASIQIKLKKGTEYGNLEFLMSLENIQISRFCYLNELNNITSLEGVKFAKNCVLTGLINVTSIDGIELREGCQLGGLEKLSSLEGVNLPAYSTLEGLINVVSLKGVGLNECCSLDDLERIITLDGVKLVEGCNLEGLKNVTSLDGIELSEDCGLGGLEKLTSLEGVKLAKGCSMYDLTSVTSLDGIDLSEGCWLGGLEKLTSLEGVKLAKDCSMNDLTSVTSLDGIELSEDCRLVGLEKLSSIEGVRLAKGCSMDGLKNVTSLDGIDLSEGCWLGGLEKLTSLEGVKFAMDCHLENLEKLTSLEGVKLIKGCVLSGLENVKSLNQLELSYDCFLYNLKSNLSCEEIKIPKGSRLNCKSKTSKKGKLFVKSLQNHEIMFSNNQASIRPQKLEEYLGQQPVKEQMGLFIEAARRRSESLDHVLIFGPPGLGKTTLANVIANELGVSLRQTSGPVIEKAGDLAALLTNLQPHDVLFIDEIHRLSPNVEEILYPAMEDFQIDIMIGEGPAARSIKLDLPPFTLVGATTRAGLLTSPLRDRIGIVQRLEFYNIAELTHIVSRSARILGIQADNDGCTEIARRARGTPRIANRLLRRVRDYAEVKGEGVITEEIVHKALSMLQVDESGLNEMDRRFLQALIVQFDGGPVGINSLAAFLSEEPGTIEDVVEPYLIQQGFVMRTSRGRQATQKAWQCLGIKPQEAMNIELIEE